MDSCFPAHQEKPVGILRVIVGLLIVVVNVVAINAMHDDPYICDTGDSYSDPLECLADCFTDCKEWKTDTYQYIGCGVGIGLALMGGLVLSPLFSHSLFAVIMNSLLVIAMGIFALSDGINATGEYTSAWAQFWWPLVLLFTTGGVLSVCAHLSSGGVASYV